MTLRSLSGAEGESSFLSDTTYKTGMRKYGMNLRRKITALIFFFLIKNELNECLPCFKDSVIHFLTVE